MLRKKTSLPGKQTALTANTQLADELTPPEVTVTVAVFSPALLYEFAHVDESPVQAFDQE